MIQRQRLILNGLMAAAAISLTACGVEMDGEEGVAGEEAELGPDEAVIAEEAATVSDGEPSAGAASPDATDDDVIAPLVSCRRVVVSSIPVYSTPSGSSVLCHFFNGDVFSHFGFVSPPGRYITWCPRGVPPSQGTTGYAQSSGTVDGGCG